MTKKISKKLFGFVICAALILTFGIVCFGFKPQSNVCVAAASTQAVVLAETSESEQPQESEDTEENKTFLGRVQEYLQENYPEIAATVGNVILFILMIVQYVKNKKKLLNIDGSVSKQGDTQSQIVGVVNDLITAYNQVEERLEDSGVSVEDRTNVKTLILQTRAVLDILTTVYANSKNIPQGIKDLVNLKYANCLKVVEGDDKKAIEEVVIDSGKEEVGVEETQKSETEV